MKITTNTPYINQKKILLSFLQEFLKNEKNYGRTIRMAKVEKILALLKKNANTDVSKYLLGLSTTLKTQLTRDFHRYVEKNYKIANPTVKEYQIQKLKPELRKELIERQKVSLALIKTQTDTSLDALYHRFLNWCTNASKDSRGSLTSKDDIFKFFIKNTIKERATIEKLNDHRDFIIRDQTRKMLGTFDNIIAKDIGAIGFIWQTREDKRVVGNPTGLYPKGNRGHENHYKRNGVFYLIKNSWALSKGYIKKNSDVEYAENLIDGMPSEPFNCRCVAKYIYRIQEIPKKYNSIITEKGNNI